MIFRHGQVIETIRGADQRKLTQAVEDAVKTARPPKPIYSSVGRTLGDTPRAGQSLHRPWNFSGFIDTAIRFFALYLISLFSVCSWGLHVCAEKWLIISQA